MTAYQIIGFSTERGGTVVAQFDSVRLDLFRIGDVGPNTSVSGGASAPASCFSEMRFFAASLPDRAPHEPVSFDI